MKVCVSSLPRTTRDAVIQTVKHVESCRLESNENLLLFVPEHNENYCNYCISTYKFYIDYHFLAEYESGQKLKFSTWQPLQYALCLRMN